MALPLHYSKQQISEEDINAVIEVLRSDWLTCGPAVEKFEKKLCEITGAKYAVACSNGTAALHLACMALGIGKGDLGVTSPITFLASANCVEFCGGEVDFIDIDSKTLCLSSDLLEEYCKTKRIPKVVIPVDFSGVPADLPAIYALSQKYGFKIIEDAAHSLGSTYNYKGETYNCASCVHSDLAILSFHPVKTITTGEGGAITTNDSLLASKLCLLRSHGITKDPAVLTRNDGPWFYEMYEIGFNYRITDIQCALGLSQLRKLESFKNRRQQIVKKYNEALAPFAAKETSNQSLVPPLILPPWPLNTSPCFHLYPVQFTKGAGLRFEIYEKLKSNAIFTQVHYFPVHLQPYYRNKYSFAEGKCPNAEIYYSGCLSLPLYPALTDSDVELIISSVKDLLQ